MHDSTIDVVHDIWTESVRFDECVTFVSLTFAFDIDFVHLLLHLQFDIDLKELRIMECSLSVSVACDPHWLVKRLLFILFIFFIYIHVKWKLQICIRNNCVFVTNEYRQATWQSRMFKAFFFWFSFYS